MISTTPRWMRLVAMGAALGAYGCGDSDGETGGTSGAGATATGGTSGTGATAGTDSGTSRLTLTWEGEGFGSTQFGSAVWVFVADDTVRRADGDYRQGPNTFRRIRTSNDPDIREWGFDVETGKTVTLVAFEDDGAEYNLFLGPPPPAPADSFDTEFVMFRGDFDASPENGVATLTMDGDREVTAVFQPMPRLTISQMREGFYTVIATVPSWLGDPALDGMPPEATCTGDECDTQCVGSNTWDGDSLSFAFKSGTTLDVTAQDCGAEWVGWQGDGNCTGRRCVFTLGQTTVARAVWSD